MAKKATKNKVIDQRVVHEHYYDLADDCGEKAEDKFLKNLTKGYIDFRLLVKPINEKLTTAISRSIPPVTMYNDNGDINVSVSLTEIHYSRHGLVVRFLVRTDDRVGGSYTEDYCVRVWSFKDLDGKPTAYGLIDKVIRTMVSALEMEFNDTLFRNKLAPSRETYWGDEDY